MDILFKAFAAALLATFVIVGAGQAFLKTNDLRNYPNVSPSGSSGSQNTGLADVVAGGAAVDPAVDPAAPQTMTEGQEAAAKSGFSTELQNPNK
jgi:hypothetical protein